MRKNKYSKEDKLNLPHRLRKADLRLRALLLAGALPLLLVLAACGGGGDKKPPSGGGVRFREKKISLSADQRPVEMWLLYGDEAGLYGDEAGRFGLRVQKRQHADRI